jgi:hypothetical protein
VLDVRIVAMLAAATLLPYLPVLFAVMPLDELLRFTLKALT